MYITFNIAQNIRRLPIYSSLNAILQNPYASRTKKYFDSPFYDSVFIVFGKRIKSRYTHKTDRTHLHKQ